MSNATVREATIEDMPAIRRCHAEIEALVGTSLDLPDVEDPAILGYYVVEEDGVITTGLYLEKSVRQCHFGSSPKGTAALAALQAQILSASKEAGVRFVHCSVFRDIPAADEISRHLERYGYARRDDLVDHMIDLRT